MVSPDGANGGSPGGPPGRGPDPTGAPCEPSPRPNSVVTVEIRRQRLRGHPVVILAACHAASTATYRHEAWSLPAAFLAAGARAVIASTDIIDDDAAGALFDDVRTRIERGASPATALRDARLAMLARNPGAAWVRSLMVFD